jgi:3-hydroxyisobutyrate dehydrogenase-like beta-hydroxyacid dehydrogenase
MTEARRVGMVGLGNMGGRIARRIRDAGYAVSGFDADADAVARSEVEAEDSLASLAGHTDVLFLSLPDSTVIEKVAYGDDGLESSVRPGQTVVDLSTADPASSMRIHADLAAKGVEFLDAGISGGAAAAEKGTLAIMVGGSADALAAIDAILATFATNVYHMGAAGSGHTAKLLNNFLNAISLAATAEVMVAGRAAGLDLAKLLGVLNHSSGVNFATQNRFPKIIEGDYLEGGLTSELMAKDVRLYLGLLRQLGVTSFTGPSCLGTFDMATALGYGKQISNRVVDAIGDAAGGIRLQDFERGGAG